MATTVSQPAENIRLAELWSDPYPAYRYLREHDPVAWVPEAGRYLVTRFEDIMHVERHPETYLSAENPSLMTRSIGETLLRQDGAAHQRLRRAAEAPLRPRIVKEHWLPAFRRNAEDVLGAVVGRGECDLFREVAGPLAARNLADLLGLRGVGDADMQEWSQAIIDAGGNYGEDPDIWARCARAVADLDVAMDEVLPVLRRDPDHSVISAMLHAGDPLTEDEIRTNVRVFLGGGLNEPRDSMAAAAYALLTHDDQREDVEAEPALWRRVFEEAVRWVSPIGMYPRRVAERTELGGRVLEPGDKLGVVIASGNRDERVFDRPDAFDIHRAETSHVAFGGGPHFCLGTWVSRAAVGQIGLPLLFRTLPGLRLAETEVPFGGWVFRGPLRLKAAWNA
ncbi:cytochrome P450 [Streptomyces sp. AK08-02]|uniref:cytochrome P450 n=1 Tax=Streptomyces sp. AK08-02 TaxID=3028654 RepID=UPI0029A77FDD|nr:cytochrome P450 [Streptomyces sp. AK08-02]MDX3748133.1 cytochrome P450 [Streptomyces sp. AK08-02]